MLGKRTRAADNSLAPCKRPLTDFIPASKPTASPVTAAKRSVPLERTPSQKENERVLPPAQQPAFDDVFIADEDEEAHAGDFGESALHALGDAGDKQLTACVSVTVLPTPPPAPESQLPDPSAPAAEPATGRGLPNVYTHASSLLSPSLSTSALSLLGRADQRDTLFAFLSRRFPAAYAAQGEAGPSTPDEGTPGPAAMYVSGPPGIGKTALVGAMVDEMRERVRERELGDEVRVAMENCATIAAGGTGGDLAWRRLGDALGVEMDGDNSLKAKERFEEGLRDGRK